MTYKGSCHCGKVCFHVEGEIEELIDCSCPHCRKKGYLLWFVPRENLTLSTPKSGLAGYTFNQHVLQHHFCPTCGCAPFGFGYDGEGEAVAAVNTRCLDDFDFSAYPVIHRDGITASLFKGDS